MVAIGGNSDNVKILDASTFAVTKTLATDHGYVNDVDFSYDSDRLLTCGDDDEFRTWKTNSGWS